MEIYILQGGSDVKQAEEVVAAVEDADGVAVAIVEAAVEVVAVEFAVVVVVAERVGRLLSVRRSLPFVREGLGQ